MKDNRYIELKKENDETLKHLSHAYNHIGNIYIKKARGYAVKSLDTELKIQDVLSKLEDFDMRNVQYNIAIPDETIFVEGNIKDLSKQIKNPDRWKTIIALSIIVLAIIAWVVISVWMRQETPNQEPQNFICEKVSETAIKVSWDKGPYASEGYLVMVESNDGKKLGYYHTLETSYIFLELDTTKTHTFYVKTVETELFGESPDAIVVYNPAE